MSLPALFRGSTALALPLMLLVAAPACAQVDERLDLNTQVPQAFDRGHNISVQQIKRPDYDPIGVPVGGFTFYPRVSAGAGATSNAYLTSNATAAPFLFVEPSAALISNWSEHLLQISADGLARDYLGQSRRNERTWTVDALTRLDATDNFTVTANGDLSRQFENAFSGEVGSNIAALSRYRRDFGSLQGTYTSGRFRTFLLADAEQLRFQPIPLTGGGVIDQSDRDRSVLRLTGQLEYARSAGLSFFAQIGGARTRFTRDLLSGDPNLDSRQLRILGGANLDISGRVRGTIGLGYDIQDYDASVYKTIKGLSVDTRVEFFPTRRATITATAERTLNNAVLTRSLPVWDTQFTLRGDYDLMANAILSAIVGYAHQNYIGSSATGASYRITGSARYFASRRVNVEGSVTYRARSSNNQNLIEKVNEARVSLGLAFHL